MPLSSGLPATLFALCLLSLGASVDAGPAMAAGSAREFQGSSPHATGVASATVISALSVQALSDLDFGSLAAVGEQGGSLVVAPGSVRARYAGGARSACSGSATERGGEVRDCTPPHAARLHVEGEPGRAYRVVLPETVSAHAAEPESRLPVLPVTGLSVRTDSRPGAGAQGVLDAAGADGIEIGGELHIPPGTAASHYRAHVPVIVVYG